MLLGLRARRKDSRRIRPILVIFAALAAILLFAAPADAQPRLDVEAGLDGWHRPGRDIVVQVEIGADQLIDGFLQVQLESGTNLTVPVELAGCLLYTSPSPRDATLSRMPSSA